MDLALRPLRPCVVTAYSAVGALGLDMGEVRAAVSAGVTGLRPGSSTLPVRTYVGAPPRPVPALPPAFAHHDARLARLAWQALGPISSAVARAVARWGASRVAIIAGSSTGGIAETEDAFRDYLRDSRAPDGYTFDRYSFDALVRFLEEATGASGPRFVVSTACASSAKSLGSAQRLLALGLVDAVLVVGADSLCRTTLHGFGGLKILSTEPCRPFDLHRDGISIGEGAAALLLEREGPGSVHLLSVGESADAHHVTAPHPEGLGATMAMNRALQMAGLEPSHIDYVNAHGTGTRVNDQVESDAIARVLGTRVPVSSTKGLTGHLLGAAGATEAVIAIDALVQGILPPNVGHTVPDPDVTVHIVERAVAANARRALSNSFAFGGCNAAVIVGEPVENPTPTVPSTIHVVGTALWAPGTPTLEAWLEGRETPGAEEPPAELLGGRAKGRASLLTRMFAEVIGRIAKTGSVDLSTVPIVFGSAYGEVSTMIRLLSELEGERVLLSPLKFQASVHNTAAGILSIETRNRGFSTCLAAGRHTAAMALLEAMAWLGVHGGEVIVALADEASAAFPAPERLHPAVATAFHLVARADHDPPRNSAGRLASLRKTTNETASNDPDPRARNPAGAALGLMRSVALRRYGVVPLVEGAGPGWALDFTPPGSGG